MSLLATVLSFAATVSSAPAVQPPVHFTVSASGDLLIHSPIASRALAYGGGRVYDFRPMFRRIRRWVAKPDLALCHVETPLVPGPPAGYPSFRTPTALADAIRATGWDVCSTASNHTLDAGAYGVGTTIEALSTAGVRHTGTARSPRGRRRAPILRAKGVPVAFLAYTALTNGQPLPTPWSLNMAEPRRILADARRARRRGARAVIVNLHWGTEYAQAPDRSQVALARRLTRSRAITAIVGQHAHVVQPIRRVYGKPVVFGEGNLISNQTAACCPAASQDGLIALLDFVARGKRVRVERVRYLPTTVSHPDYTVLPAGRGSASWARTVQVAGRGRGIRPLP